MIEGLWPAVCHGNLVSSQSEETATSHGEVAVLVGGCAQSMLNASQEVIRLQDEDQFSWDAVQ